MFMVYVTLSTQVKTGHLHRVKRNQTNLIVAEVAKAFAAWIRDFIKLPAEEEMKILAEENNQKYGLPMMPLGVDISLIRQVGSLSTWAISCICTAYS